MNDMKKAIVGFVSIFLLLVFCTKAQEVDALWQQAEQHYRQSNYGLAIEDYLEVIKDAEANHQPELIIEALWAIARCHYYLHDHKTALSWYYKALHAITKFEADTLLGRAYYYIGAMYIEALQVDSAEKYGLKAVAFFKHEGNYVRLSQTYSTLAELHINTTQNPDIIHEMIDNAEKYAMQAGDKGMLAFAKSKRYNYNFFLKKDYAEALMHINQAEQLYLETGNREAIINAYRAKAECLIMLRDTSARTYMLRWFEFKDSVFQAEKAAQVAKFETLYETEKKQQENEQLLQENELSRLQIQTKNRTLFLVVAVFLLFILTALWLYNRNNLKKKQQELMLLQNLQKDKERIARDLHDNVGGQLSYIIYSLDGINDENPTKRSELTESINAAVRSVIGSLRETIWAISDANIEVNDFSDKLKVFVRTLFKHTATEVMFKENVIRKRELNALLGLNLYRICQEILNNAFKYAKASQVEIQMNCNEEKLEIVIADNGVGFDYHQEKTECYGLQNMKKRASEFGISLDLYTEIGKGTKYVLIV